MNDRRLPAEWEPCGAVLLAWPHEATDWKYMLDSVQACYDELIHAVARHAIAIVIGPGVSSLRDRWADIAPERLLTVDIDTNDTWTRDYGVITLRDNTGRPLLADFRFNAWGGKFESHLDDAVTATLHRRGLLRGTLENHHDYVLEGGAIESDGHGTLLTTASCMLTDTRNSVDRATVTDQLCRRLGVDHVLWLDHGYLEGDDTDGHIDTLARIAPHDTILYCASAADDDDRGPQHDALDAMLADLQALRTRHGQPFNLIELPLPDPIYDSEGQRLPATYANFLIVNGAILMPSYGQPRKDMLAEMTLRVAFPDHSIERVDCRALIQQHGSLHCATMQLQADTLPI